MQDPSRSVFNSCAIKLNLEITSYLHCKLFGHNGVMFLFSFFVLFILFYRAIVEDTTLFNSLGRGNQVNQIATIHATYHVEVNIEKFFVQRYYVFLSISLF